MPLTYQVLAYVACMSSFKTLPSGMPNRRRHTTTFASCRKVAMNHLKLKLTRLFIHSEEAAAAQHPPLLLAKFKSYFHLFQAPPSLYIWSPFVASAVAFVDTNQSDWTTPWSYCCVPPISMEVLQSCCCCWRVCLQQHLNIIICILLPSRSYF